MYRQDKVYCLKLKFFIKQSKQFIMGSISIEGYVKAPSKCQNVIINNELGGVSKEELNALINKFNSLDSNSVDVDSVSGI